MWFDLLWKLVEKYEGWQQHAVEAEQVEDYEQKKICIYLLFNFEFRAPIKLWIIWSYLNDITDLCFGIDTDSLLIMSASVVYQNDWHAGMHWRNCISILHSLIFVKLNMPITKVCFFIFVASFNLMRSALPFLFISSFAPHCRPPNGWAQCHPLPTFHVGPIFSPSCAWLRGCVKVGTVLWVFLAEKEWKKTEGVL